MSGWSQRPRQADDDGFTLIELLVVVIIIGILAAIAIPAFLNQRMKGYDAQAKSDLQSLAKYEEIYLTDYQSYGSGAQLVAAEGTFRHSRAVTVSVVGFTTNQGYCLSAASASGRTFYYDSLAGGLQPYSATRCPTNYVTADGVSIP